MSMWLGLANSSLDGAYLKSNRVRDKVRAGVKDLGLWLFD